MSISSDEDDSEKCNVPTSSSLQQMLQTISEERKKATTFSIGDEFEMVDDASSFWTTLFKKYFIELSGKSDETRDDMLFYIRKVHDVTSKSVKMKPEIEVYRRDSKSLPTLGDSSIDWEETVYLNIILHQFEYTVTCAVCTRTDANNLQILKKFSQRVYPSPSRRRMDSKGTGEEMTYPNIFFTVDNFEEAFTDIIVRDSEMVCVELIASDRKGVLQGVIFLGSIKYEALKQVYDSKLSMTSKMVQTMSLGWIQHNKRVEFVRMRGPQSKGHAEMAVSRVKGSGPETPDMENFPVDDFDDNQQNDYAQRRMSDPSASIGSLVRGGLRRMSMKKSQSQTERVDGMTDAEGYPEVEATTLQDALSEGPNINGFLGKTFGQAWQLFKDRRRATSVALNSYLTYITLPWHRIIADVLECHQKPILIF